MKKSEYPLKTSSGHDLREARSALQKSIRRGQELNALYWAHELLAAGYIPYLLTTLGLIASEDIGIADPAKLAAINASLSLWLTIHKERKQKADYRQAVGAVILLMCRARKSRVADDAINLVIERKKRGWRLEIPDVALDSHCERGRALTRGNLFWVRQGSKVHPRATEAEIGGTDYRSEAEDLWLENIIDPTDYSEWRPDDPNAAILPIPFESNKNDDSGEDK